MASKNANIIMNLTANEKRKIAKELFLALLREAKGQGKTVEEMLQNQIS